MVAAFSMEKRSCEMERGQLKGTDHGPWLTASKEMGLQSHNLKEMNHFGNLREPGS